MARYTTTWMRIAKSEKGRAEVWCAAQQLTKLLGCRVYRLNCHYGMKGYLDTLKEIYKLFIRLITK